MTISNEAAAGMETVELEPLREDKKRIFKDILGYFETHQRGYIKVPTGWGKTFLAKHIMKKYYEDGKIVLFLISKNNPLLSQTYYDRKREKPLFPSSALLSSEHKISRKEIAEALKKSAKEKEGFVLFASLQTLLGKQASEIKELLLEYTDLAIVDEIHNFINNRGNSFLNELGERTRIMGMTATPFQGVVGNVKFVDEIAGDMREVYTKTLPECILDNELAPLKYTIAESSEDIFEIFDFEKGLDELDKQDLFLDCSTADKLKKVIKRTQLAKDVYDSMIKQKNSKTLIFCAPVRKKVYGAGAEGEEINAFHAKITASVFNEEIPVQKLEKDPDPVLPLDFDNYTPEGEFKNTAFITSELPKDEQNALLAAFRDAEKPPYILCTVGMLIEGFDFPALESLILLRPTLSMRLFEQQVGRVTRLSPVSGKNKGNIFEISDSIDSLYQRFGEGVFNGEKVDQVQMLQPEIRLEELFSEGDAARAIEEGKIEINKVDFSAPAKGKGKGARIQEMPVRLPPTAIRSKYFSRLLALTEEKDIGAFEREKRELMRAALRFRVRELMDAEELSGLSARINKLKREAYEDRRLGDLSRQHKPKVFGEVEWLLKLQALNSLKYNGRRISAPEKNKILRTLGFEPDMRKIDSYRLKCLKLGSAQKTIPDLVKVLGFVSRLSSSETYQFLDKKKKEQWKREFLPAVYWGFCFIEDSPELKELFESTEWDRRVKNIIRQK
ncbi:DEAD/DEAH box helicase [Methanosarcina mazei]|jgi:superfamily II DNA or RNA helicase|uniref:RNA helicase n=6 Tax=Methanosarcina mazei TaxID=2209 RepID=A0A0F8L162_METMZ|nr:DEAD/DEAH box helicase [Methanosarcina mazei]AAM33001.1 putative DNA or RNA helicase of superfamily II [Methanosarcina mazei Go1]AKB40345.1 putative DNA or RNA helicase of superfamily II [Methanosarcina mazei WWM610]AKB61283.1 putative DNA or RNA helicase of superfamily II [Methanosarcina mazei SarPi]AKB64576.1 putative DNA or RNA helicase of superfamily II [Methanosarcina mazei S-6]AKB68415.1 putative DNA or RNA helicase of superfamily II [Methanosarcina mazei LYC]